MMSASTSDQISKSENCSHKKGTLYIIAGLTTQNLVFQLVHYFRYFLVRYEHLVENTMNVTKQLYRFSGLKFDDTARRRVLKLTHGAEGALGAFQLARPGSFHHNHWLQELDRKTGRKIEQSPDCQYFMRKMNYKKVFV